MGKRSNFERKPRDSYATPYSALEPLLPHLSDREEFGEPCAGDGILIELLEAAGHKCVLACDLYSGGFPKRDATTMRTKRKVSCFITNPPWTRTILHPIILNLSSQAPTWLLFDADWMHNLEAKPLLPRCTKIVSIGRVKWIPGSKHTGMDNCCWYRFEATEGPGPLMLGRTVESGSPGCAS